MKSNLMKKSQQQVMANNKDNKRKVEKVEREKKVEKQEKKKRVEKEVKEVRRVEKERVGNGEFHRNDLKNTLTVI